MNYKTPSPGDIGLTPRLCQDAMIEMLQALFEGKTFGGPGGRKPLNFYPQDIPVPDETDYDADTDNAPAPYVIVKLDGGVIRDEDKPQVMDMSLIICTYDAGKDRLGYQDAANIKEDIVQKVCTQPYFGGAFTVQKPIAWAMQEDDTHHYYYAAVTLSVTAPAMTQDTELEALT